MTKVCFLEQPGKRSPDSVMPLTVEQLRELGCSVEVLVPEWEPSIVRCLTLDADLYVWKSHERLCDSLAAEIHARRLPLINDYCGTLQVRDKIVTSMRLMEAGLPTPEAYYASSVEQLRAIVKDYPIVVKPNSGRRGQQISVVRSPEDLDTLELTYSDIFAQQLVRGGGLDRAAAGRGRFCMSSPRCLVIGAGRVAGGFVAPLLRDAGWEVTFVSRNRAIVDSVNEGGGLWVRTTEDSAIDRWIGGVSAVSLHDHELPRLATRADLLATSVGPSALPAVGKALAPLLCARVASSDSPINIVTFENYRRAPEILATSLMREDSSLAGKICRRVGIGGAVVWRAISRRTITDGGLRFEADVTSECYADALPLVPGAAPLDGSIPGISLVRAFDDRMVEKLWVFNAGHAAAAYLGWRAGLATLGEAMSDPEISASVAGVVVEAQQAFEAYLNTRLASASIPQRPLYSILDRYADPALADPVTRVARDPRRKLAAGDRLVGPGTACLAAGIRPGALATASAAAVAYSEESDPQAVDLQRELKLLGPEEVLATVSTLHPQDEFVRLVCESYENHSGRQETEAGPPLTTYYALGRV